MRDNILVSYIAIDILFVVGGGLLLVFALMTKAELDTTPTLDNVARDLLFDMCPLNGQYSSQIPVCPLTLSAAIADSVLIFITFLLTVPAIVMPMTRGWLKFSGYMVVVCAFFTMIIGLDIWFETLKSRENLSVVFRRQPASTQSLLQQSVGISNLLHGILLTR